MRKKKAINEIRKKKKTTTEGTATVTVGLHATAGVPRVAGGGMSWVKT